MLRERKELGKIKIMEEKIKLVGARILVAFSFAFLVFSLFFEVLADTPTYDEPANMAASFDYVYRQDFRLYPDNPPLVKILAGLSLLPLAKKIVFPSELSFYREPSQFDLYQFGTRFLYQSGNPAEAVIFLCRLPNILFTLVLGFLLYFFAKKLYGEKAGLFALLLFSLDPNIRGHGHILAFDLPLAFWSLLLFYLGFLFLLYPKKRIIYLFFIPLTLTFGLLTKFTFLFFLPPYFFGIFLYWRKKPFCSQKALFLLSSFWLLASFSLFWFFAFFSGYHRLTLDYEKIPLYQSAEEVLGGNFIWRFLSFLPLPYYYRAGIKVMLAHNFVSQPAFLLGEVHAKNDWFFYFPISFFLKTPLPTLFFLFATLFLILRKFFLTGEKLAFRSVFPFLVGMFFFLCLMLFSHINNVYRYLFPAFVFFILGASQFVEILRMNKFFFRLIFFVGIFWLFFTSLFSFPLDLSYTNELTGFPPSGHLFLSDSEIDWGQDLKRLSLWLKKNHLEKEKITLSYLGTADPAYYGIAFQPLKFADLDKLSGIVAMSVGNLTLGDWAWTSRVEYRLGWEKAPLDFLRRRRPEAVIGKSIFLYFFPRRK